MSALVVLSFVLGPVLAMTALSEGAKYFPNQNQLPDVDPYALKIILCAFLLISPLIVMILLSIVAWYMVPSYGMTQKYKSNAFDFIYDMSVVLSACITIFMLCMFMYSLRDSSFVYACLLANMYAITVIQRNMSASRVWFAPFFYAVFSAAVMYVMIVNDPRLDPYFVRIGDEFLNIRFKERKLGDDLIHENKEAITNKEQYELHKQRYSDEVSMYADQGPFNDRVNGLAIVAPSVFNEPLIAIAVLSLTIFCAYSFFCSNYRSVYQDKPSTVDIFDPSKRGEENLHRFLSVKRT